MFCASHSCHRSYSYFCAHHNRAMAHIHFSALIVLMPSLIFTFLRSSYSCHRSYPLFYAHRYHKKRSELPPSLSKQTRLYPLHSVNKASTVLSINMRRILCRLLLLILVLSSS